jgi:beta-phosphoglucomutase-like phosphatase (HAD superfamily)
MGARPERTFVVEGTAAGVAAAVAAGMRAIGYTGASHGYPGLADALTDAGAETVISRWSGFLPVLLALSDWRDG